MYTTCKNLLYVPIVCTICCISCTREKKFYKNSEDVGMAQKAHKQDRDVTQ